MLSPVPSERLVELPIDELQHGGTRFVLLVGRHELAGEEVSVRVVRHLLDEGGWN